MARLLDKIEKAEKAVTKSDKKKAAVVQIAQQQQAGAKDKLISVKVNSAMYKTFTDVCRARGLSNNSAINMLLSAFIKDNETYLDNAR